MAGGTGYVNYEDLLGLNAPQAESEFGRLYGNLDRQGQQAQQGIDQATSAFNSQVQAGTPMASTLPNVPAPDDTSAFQRAKAGVTAGSGGFSNATHGVTAGSPPRGVYAAAPDLATRQSDSTNVPGGFTVNADGTLTAPTYNYSGPQAIDLGGANAAANQFGSNLSAAQTPGGGFGSQVQGLYGGNYTAGMGALDSALAGGVDNGRLSRLQAKYGSLFDNLNAAQGHADSAVSNANNTVAGYNDQAGQYAAGYNDTVNKNRATRDAAAQQAANLQSQKDQEMQRMKDALAKMHGWIGGPL